MSNLTRADLERIYDAYHIVFLNIAKEAEKYGVDLDIYISDRGSITLKASDFSDNEFGKTYEIMQTSTQMAYEERKYKRG